jgi:hypothetical protein
MRRVSPKRAVLARQRAKLSADLRLNPRRCEFPLGCPQTADAWHEYLSRGQGGSITDPNNLLGACNPHNVWAEDNPIEAHDIGWRYCKKRAAELSVSDGVWMHPVRLADGSVKYVSNKERAA